MIVVAVSVPVLALPSPVSSTLRVSDPPSPWTLRLPLIPSTVPGAGVPTCDRIVAVTGVDIRLARNVADDHGVVVTAAVHRDVIRVDRAEQSDHGARRIDVVDIAADDDVSSRLDERAGLQREVAPGAQFDIAAHRLGNRDAGLDSSVLGPVSGAVVTVVSAA